MDSSDLSYTSVPAPQPPQILTRTLSNPRRFPFPEEVPDLDEDDSSDSSRSLLRSKDYIRKSVYDPLPFCHSNEASISTSFFQPFHSRPKTPGICTSTLIVSQVPSKLFQNQQLQTSTHFQLENQKVSKILEESTKSRGFLVKTLFILILFLLLIVTALIGICGILFVKLKNQEYIFDEIQEPINSRKMPSPYESLLWHDVGQHEILSSHLMSLFKSEKIRENLQWISKDIHVAGTENQLALMDKIHEYLDNLGFEVTPYKYETLLNYPDYDNPNAIHLWNGFDWDLISNGLSDNANFGIAELEQDLKSKIWWNAYANNGTAIGNVVFANYGTEEDYAFLEKQNVSLRGKLALVRYGGVFRGDKAKGAEKRGASGVIIYSDPADFVLSGNLTFPEQIWLPSSAAQRGTLLRTFGDPQTPVYPSKNYAFREFSEDELRKNGILPRIPVMPIGYKEAKKIMEALDGPEALWPRWRGTMKVGYKLTGKAVFRLDVKSFSERRKIKNVVAIFRGSEEPDRVVALSNHVDAWVNGAIDPGTGTATLLEIARVVKEAYDFTGWRPRRSLAFCLWDAEEFGLIGSTEYVEEMLRSIQKNVVAVINVDNINGNGTVNVKSVPLLYRSIVKAAGKIAHPNPSEIENDRPTLLDAWRFYTPKGPLPGDKSVPAVGLPSSGSDHHRFISFAGVAVADLKLESAPIYSYMLYHTRFEVPWTVENLLDPSGQVLIAAGKFWLEIGRNLADSLLIPFGIDDYALFLSEQLKRLDTQLIYLGIDVIIGNDFYKNSIQNLNDAVASFHQTAKLLQQLISSVNAGDRPLSLKQVEMLNSRLQNLEHCFILDYGVYDDRKFHRHSVFAPAKHDLGENSAFSLVLDPVAELVQAETEDAKEYWIREIKKSFTKLQYTIESATHLLQIDGF